MAYEYLSVERNGPITILRLSNPPDHTMINAQVEELHQAFDEAESEPDSRIVILTGGSPDIFIKHYEVADILKLAAVVKDLPPTPQDSDDVELHRINQFCLRMEASRLITIAAINGSAGGGGCELAMGCDFRLMKEGGYHFGLFEILAGIIPGAGGTQRFVRLLGTAKALDLILHGTLLSPQEALDLGLVHRVFPASSYEIDVLQFAETLLKRSPIALAAAKRSIHTGSDLWLEQGLKVEQAAFIDCIKSPEAITAMQAYLDGNFESAKGAYPDEPLPIK